MVIKGKCRGNGSQLADYLLKSQANDRAHVLQIDGTASPRSLKKSLLEMSLTSELNGNTDAGLYHAEISPRSHEAASMTPDEWLRAADVLGQSLSLHGAKRAVVLHEKEGRIHGHVVWERYDHETGKMWDDDRNYQKHTAAARQIEKELGHEYTPVNKRHLDRAAKAELTQLWHDHPDAASFKAALEQAGFELAQGIDRRPFKLINRDGATHDLSRQLEGVRQKDVAERLNPIRHELRTETDAIKNPLKSQETELEQPQPEAQQSDNLRELSDSQDVAAAMQKRVRAREKTETPPLLREAANDNRQSDNLRELSDSQDLLDAMLKKVRVGRKSEEKTQSDNSRELSDHRETQHKAVEQTKKQQQERTLTDEAAKMLRHYQEQQGSRDKGLNLDP